MYAVYGRPDTMGTRAVRTSEVTQPAPERGSVLSGRSQGVEAYGASFRDMFDSFSSEYKVL